jgi:HprK-related kinase A
MLTVASLSRNELAARLAGDGIRLRTGRFTARLQADIPAITEGIALLYPDYVLEPDDAFADFHLQIARPWSVRRWFRPQIELLYDGRKLFQPLPLPQALPVFEWGLNWCVSSRAHRYLMVHAAVMERNGRALILPAPPGSGKSTLTAALVGRGGWRLLSDELTLLDLDDMSVVPNPRPVSLKNQSIDVIRRYVPDAVLSPAVRDTVKGTVAHMRAPAASVARSHEPALPAWVIFPKYEAGAASTLAPMASATTFMELAANSFNYSVLAQRGFQALGRLIDQVQGYRFRYSDLDEALEIMSRLTPPN